MIKVGGTFFSGSREHSRVPNAKYLWGISVLRIFMSIYLMRKDVMTEDFKVWFLWWTPQVKAVWSNGNCNALERTVESLTCWSPVFVTTPREIRNREGIQQKYNNLTLNYRGEREREAKEGNLNKNVRSLPQRQWNSNGNRK